MNEPMRRATDLATFYFRTIAEHAGVNWTGDNDSEVRQLVAYIVEAARADLRPRFEAALERITALEQRAGAGTAEGETGADVVLEHITECADAKALIVVDGSADEVIERMVAAGWKLSERMDKVAGKRIRFLEVPGAQPAL